MLLSVHSAVWVADTFKSKSQPTLQNVLPQVDYKSIFIPERENFKLYSISYIFYIILCRQYFYPTKAAGNPYFHHFLNFLFSFHFYNVIIWNDFNLSPWYYMKLLSTLKQIFKNLIYLFEIKLIENLFKTCTHSYILYLMYLNTAI